VLNIVFLTKAGTDVKHVYRLAHPPVFRSSGDGSGPRTRETKRLVWGNPSERVHWPTPLRDRANWFHDNESPSNGEELVPHSSRVWPDETLERGFPRPFAKEGKTGGGQASIAVWLRPFTHKAQLFRSCSIMPTVTTSIFINV